mmetsp:Transcript_73152/g.214361  ORF Transcript_73152/g.214361 Transcript_73152/m.214361 type:complete len:427 (-) Transcript_73152:1509-2789(-)
MISGPVRLQAQRHVHVAHALVRLRVLHAAVPVDVHLAAHGPRLLVDHLAAHGLHGLLEALVPGQVLPREEVREGDLVAPEGHLEEGLVQLHHVPPDLHVCVHGPLAGLVGVLVRVREGVLLVELRRVPGEQGHDVEALPDGRGEDVHARLVADVEDGVELGDGVGVARVLRVRDVHLVVAHRVEDPAELELQSRETPLHGLQGVRHVARHDQHVVLERVVVDGVDPVLVVLVVEVDVREGEDPRRALGPFQVRPEPCIEPGPSSGGLPEHQLLEASTPSLLCPSVLLLHRYGPRKLGVGLLVKAESQQRTAKLTPGVGDRWAGSNCIAPICNCEVPVSKARERSRPVRIEDGTEKRMLVWRAVSLLFRSCRDRRQSGDRQCVHGHCQSQLVGSSRSVAFLLVLMRCVHAWPFQLRGIGEQCGYVVA